jgi:hypothetical protein
MGFTSIFETPGLPPAARRRARTAGPRAVAMRSNHASLLRSAGFADVTELDVTPAFRDTAAAWLAESEAHADQLAELEPPGAFEQRLRDRRALLTAIDAGLLRRALFLARRAGPESTILTTERPVPAVARDRGHDGSFPPWRTP